MRRKLKLGEPSKVVGWSRKWSDPVQLSRPWQRQPVPDWPVTPACQLPTRTCRVICTSSAWWAAPSPPVSLPAHFGLGLEILASFDTLRQHQPELRCWLLECCQHSWGSQEMCAACRSLGDSAGGWDKPGRHACRACLILSGLIQTTGTTMVEMTTQQHSTSTQSPSQGNISPAASGQESCYCR